MDQDKIKKEIPYYPAITLSSKETPTFKTLIRKRYEGVYYIKTITATGESLEKAVHNLHKEVYCYLMSNFFPKVKDNNQINELKRLEELNT